MDPNVLEIAVTLLAMLTVPAMTAGSVAGGLRLFDRARDRFLPRDANDPVA